MNFLSFGSSTLLLCLTNISNFIFTTALALKVCLYSLYNTIGFATCGTMMFTHMYPHTHPLVCNIGIVQHRLLILHQWITETSNKCDAVNQQNKSLG